MAGFGQMQKCAFSLSLDSFLMNISHLRLKCKHLSIRQMGGRAVKSDRIAGEGGVKIKFKERSWHRGTKCASPYSSRQNEECAFGCGLHSRKKQRDGNIYKPCLLDDLT